MKPVTPRWIARAVFAALLAVVLAPAAAIAADPPPLAAYGALPPVERMALSPTGRRIAMLNTTDGKRAIEVMDTDHNLIGRFAVGDIKIRSFDFIDDDMLLIQRSTTRKLGFGFAQDKFEFYQAVILSVSTGTANVVFSDRRSLLPVVFGYYGQRMVDGRPKAYFGAVELTRASDFGDYQWDNGRPALYEVDLVSNKSKRVDEAPPEGVDRDWLVGADGEVLARFDIGENDGKWTIENGAGDTIARGRNERGHAGLVVAGKDGNSIIYSALDTDGGTTRWYGVSLDGSDPPQEVFADIDIDRIFTDHSTGRLIGYATGAEPDKPVFFAAADGERVAAIKRAFPSVESGLIDWTPGFGKVLVRTSGNADSGSYFYVDLDTRRADAIAYERPQIESDMVGAISTVNYDAADGTPIDAILTLPPGRDPHDLPLVMLPHGGPGSQSDPDFDWWAQAFASRGYAVLQPNFRGSTNRDEAFQRAGDGQWGRKMQTDLSDGIAALAKRGIVDPARVCIVGGSYGGYAALAGVTLQHGIYRCAVSYGGISDVGLMSKTEQREGGDSRILNRSLEQQLGPKSGYRDISPRRRADEADAPILLIHGRDDTVVSFEQSAAMEDALKDAHKPYKLIALDGEDHWLSKADTRLAMLKASLAFVEKYDPPN